MVNWIIIAISALLSYVALQNPLSMERLILLPSKMRSPDTYYRFLSSGFIHANWTHFFFNMFTLFFFGPIVEEWLNYKLGRLNGSFVYLFFYLVSIVIASVPSFLKHRKDFRYASLGASGAVSAVLLASILLNPLDKVCLFAILCLPGFVLAPLFLIYSSQASRNQDSRINHDAHFYGAVFGLIFIPTIDPGTISRFISSVHNYITTLL